MCYNHTIMSHLVQRMKHQLLQKGVEGDIMQVIAEIEQRDISQPSVYQSIESELESRLESILDRVASEFFTDEISQKHYRILKKSDYSSKIFDLYEELRLSFDEAVDLYLESLIENLAIRS